MSINPTDIDTIPVMDNSFVYETFERMPDGTLMPVSDKTNIQVVAKREKTVIIPNNIQLTYPLQFKVEDLVAGPEVEEVIDGKNKKTKKSKNKETTTPKYYTTKSPNKFFIYRKAWVEQFKVEGHQYSMTDISGFIAERWRREPEVTKAVFIDLAEKAKIMHKERYGGVRKIRNNKKKEKKAKNNNRVNKIYNNKINNNSNQVRYYNSNIIANNINNINSHVNGNINNCLINDISDTCFLSNNNNLLGSDGGSSLININSCDTYTLPYYTSDITAQYHQQPFLNYNMSYNDTSTSSITSSPQLSYDNISSGVSCEGSPRSETTSYLELCPSGHDGSQMLLIE